MVWNNDYQQNNVVTNNVNAAQTPPGRKLLLVSLVVVILCVFMIVIFSVIGSDSPASRAKEAARKEIPNAEVKDVIVADGFAAAIVYVPEDNSQLGSGNISIFRVNQDDSMTYIASASYFSPIDLLIFGVPLETQAKLRETDVNDIKQELADSCNYQENSNGSPGFSGFEGSFKPDGWQIDSASREGISQVLNVVIQSNNTSKNEDNKIICVNTEPEGSDVNVDESTFISTFKLRLQFVTAGGAITNHEFTFTGGPIYSRTYTLDGKQININ